ncbi:MAG: cysteine desulfurase, partial [Nanoarchaeota archaeon]
SINILANSISSLTGKRNRIVLTEMEHHSNLVPWQQLAKRTGMSLSFIKMKDDFTLDHDDAVAKIDEHTSVAAFTHISNALGTINDVKRIAKHANSVGALSVVDGAQSAAHLPVDVKSLGCDFFAFSAHKMAGPTGIGALYGRKELLEQLPPSAFGGDMISSVSYDDALWNELPMKFEAGTPNMAGAAGFAAAIDYLKNIGMDKIAGWEQKLLSQLLGVMTDMKTYTPGAKKSSGILSFNLPPAHPHDVASLLDDDGIAVRGGHHCAMPLMDKVGVAGTVRASFYLYNTEEDVQALIESLKRIRGVFNG